MAKGLLFVVLSLVVGRTSSPSPTSTLADGAEQPDACTEHEKAPLA
jgi:hypothetical protein